MDSKKMGACIRDIRKAEGLTAEAFGKSIGLAGSFIARIERGDVNAPSVATLSKIVNAVCKFDSVRNYDIDLTQYDPDFVNQIYAVLQRDGLTKNYTLNGISDKLSELGESIDALDKDELSKIAWYAQRKAQKNEYKKEISETRPFIDRSHFEGEKAQFAILFNKALTFMLENIDNEEIDTSSVRRFSIDFGTCLMKEADDVAFSLPIDMFKITRTYLEYGCKSDGGNEE